MLSRNLSPGFFIGIISAIVVEITTLPELVGAYVSLISFIYGYTFRASITGSNFFMLLIKCRMVLVGLLLLLRVLVPI